MKVLLVSDKASPYLWDYFDKKNFQNISFVLSCGDLPASYLDFLTTMLGVPVYYVPGNHDKSYADDPPEGCDCLDGKLVNIQGLRILGLGGCRASFEERYQYSEATMAKRIRKMGRALRKNNGFDILLSHAPAFGLGDGKDKFHQGFECFRTLLEVYQPKYHIFGHQHKSYTYEKPLEQFGSTHLINAYGYVLLEL